LEQLLRRPETRYLELPGARSTLPIEVIHKIEIAAKYAGYIQRQEEEVNRLKSLDSKEIPATFHYDSVRGLRHESRQKLEEIRPGTLGQASRISGITPADISLLSVWVRRFGSTTSCASGGTADSVAESA
jgi:tRNA uridine 5-carboxymethylaminomethyl modification enzyme